MQLVLVEYKYTINPIGIHTRRFVEYKRVCGVQEGLWSTHTQNEYN